MTKAVVLGGLGGIGSVAVRALRAGTWFDEVVVADARSDADVVFDADDPSSVRTAIAGADVVVNCVGPFYRFGVPLLQAAIDEGIDYVDICDDLDPTLLQLELSDAAVAAGVCAVVGIGNSPGLANVMVRFAADELLDELRSVDIMHVHGGEPEEGPAVVKHRIHAMTNDVPVFVDGAFRDVRLLEESGQEFVEPTEFRDVGTLPVYPYPHPETITLPRTFPGLRRATNRGVIFPLPYFEFTMQTVRAGLAACGGSPTEADIDGWVETILGRRAQFFADAGITGPAGCLKVVVSGEQAGEPHTYTFSFSSTESGAGEGTGIPAALAAILLHQGKITGPGVHPPEAIVPPVEMLALVPAVLPTFGFGAGDASPLHVEHRLPNGSTEEMTVL